MPIRILTSEDVIAGGSRIMRAGVEGGKLVVAYGKPALEKSASLTAQVNTHLLCV